MNILLLSPHADDIELGCGGSIIKFIEKGERLFWVVFSIDSSKEMKSEFLEVMDGMAITEYKIFNFKRRILHKYRQEILQHLVDIGRDFSPDLVICPSLRDYHQDHKTIAEEAVRAFKKTSIICYELSWNIITFSSQCFIELKKRHIEKKLEMLKIYKSQLVGREEYFSKDFIYGIAKVRGVQSGSDYAESFEIIRWKI